jgi:hypothetical protein
MHPALRLVMMRARRRPALALSLLLKFARDLTACGRVPGCMCFFARLLLSLYADDIVRFCFRLAEQRRAAREQERGGAFVCAASR